MITASRSSHSAVFSTIKTKRYMHLSSADFRKPHQRDSYSGQTFKCTVYPITAKTAQFYSAMTQAQCGNFDSWQHLKVANANN